MKELYPDSSGQTNSFIYIPPFNILGCTLKIGQTHRFSEIYTLNWSLCEIYTLNWSLCFVFCSGPISSGCHDGARLRNDCRDQPVFLRFCQRAPSSCENSRHVSTLFWTTVLATSLWLRHEGGQVSPHSRRQSKGYSFHLGLNAKQLDWRWISIICKILFLFFVNDNVIDFFRKCFVP